MSWQEDTLRVIEGIAILLDSGFISKEKANELIVKYGVYDLEDGDLVK